MLDQMFQTALDKSRAAVRHQNHIAERVAEAAAGWLQTTAGADQLAQHLGWGVDSSGKITASEIGQWAQDDAATVVGVEMAIRSREGDEAAARVIDLLINVVSEKPLGNRPAWFTIARLGGEQGLADAVKLYLHPAGGHTPTGLAWACDHIKQVKESPSELLALAVAHELGGGELIDVAKRIAKLKTVR